MKTTLFVFLLVLLLLLFLTSINANTFVVTNINASGSGSLTEAVESANALGGQDTILFSPGVRGTIYNTGVLQLTDGLVMIGPGPDLLAISANNTGRVMFINYCYGKNFVFDGLTFKDGRSTTGGGAGICGVADTVKIRNCIIRDNQSVYQYSGGGGIAVFTTGYLAIENCLIYNNRSYVGGSGLTMGSETIADVSNTSICNNLTTGNAVYGGGGIYCAGRLTMYNCTISGNSHPTRGGGIYVYGFLNLENCTVTENYADNCGGIFDTSAAISDSVIILSHTIVSGNTSNTSSKDLYGRIYSHGYNLIGVQTGASVMGDTAGNLYGADPLLEPLDTLSPTVLLHRLQAGSPAIDNGNNSTCTAVDQRGISRPQDGNDDGSAVADIGAFEFLVDADDDGTPDNVEMGQSGSDANYDGNGDGIADRTQSNVASLWNYDSTIYFTIASPDSCVLTGVAPVENPSENGLPQGLGFPIGFLKFTVGLNGITAPISIMVYFPPNVSITDYYKYGSTTDLTLPHWYQFNYDSQTGAEVILPNVLKLHLVDGGRGDHDVTVNGYIIDPGGPVGTLTAVDDGPDHPGIFSLSQNYPNPFNPTTIIAFDLTHADYVTITVYDVLGQKVITLIDEYVHAGSHRLKFDATKIPSGLYFYRLQAGKNSETKKLLLLR